MRVQNNKIKIEIPDYVKKYFWEIDTDKLDIYKDKPYITTRLLEYGDQNAIKWLLLNMSKQRIKQSLLKTREISQKSANFWSEYFNIPKNKILCLKKSYQKMQKTHWPY